jgi:thiamine-phosphate diphosphorylase
VKLAELCIRRPVFATMLVLLFVVLGAMSYVRLGVDLFPNVDFPITSISTTLKGASVEEVETRVTKPLEESINQIQGIDELSSQTKEGLSRIVVQFKLERDGAEAAQDVRDKVSVVLAQLPEDVDPPVVVKFDFDASPIMRIAVSGQRDPREITEIARKRIKEDIETLSGVGSVTIIGGEERAVQIYVDTDKLDAYDLSIGQVRRALAAQNIEVPGGRIDQGSRELVLRTMGRLPRVEDFNDLIVGTLGERPVMTDAHAHPAARHADADVAVRAADPDAHPGRHRDARGHADVAVRATHADPGGHRHARGHADLAVLAADPGAGLAQEAVGPHVPVPAERRPVARRTRRTRDEDAATALLSAGSDHRGGPPHARRSTFAPAPLYPIIDGADLDARARLIDAVLAAGTPWLQLRCKGTPADAFLRAAMELVARAARRSARVIVNDRLDVALAAGAAGVHLGQHDLPLGAARRIAGDAFTIGVSTHDVAEARAAADGGADYVGFGPMFATASKADTRPRRTLEDLARVRAAVAIPIVAIGGIGADSAAAVLDAGADAVAVIGALEAAPDPAAFVARVLALGRARG